MIKQSGGGDEPPHAVMESTKGADHSAMGVDGSEYQTSQQQQQQHVTDQLGNLSVHHGEGVKQVSSFLTMLWLHAELRVEYLPTACCTAPGKSCCKGWLGYHA